MFRSHNYNNRSHSMPLIAQVGIFLILVIVAFKGYRLFKGANIAGKAIVQDITKSVQVSEVKTALHQSGISDVRSSAVEEASDDIYAAFYTDSWYGGEDEQKAIDTLNGLQSIGECKAVSRIYKTNTKKVLLADFKKFLSTAELSKIKQSYLKAISL